MKRTHVVGWDGVSCRRCDLDLGHLAQGARWTRGTELVVDGNTVRPLGPLEDPPKVCQARPSEARERRGRR